VCGIDARDLRVEISQRYPRRRYLQKISKAEISPKISKEARLIPERYPRQPKISPKIFDEISLPGSFIMPMHPV
jgi:hypothetical protein